MINSQKFLKFNLIYTCDKSSTDQKVKKMIYLTYLKDS